MAWAWHRLGWREPLLKSSGLLCLPLGGAQIKLGQGAGTKAGDTGGEGTQAPEGHADSGL